MKTVSYREFHKDTGTHGVLCFSVVHGSLPNSNYYDSFYRFYLVNCIGGHCANF